MQTLSKPSSILITKLNRLCKQLDKKYLTNKGGCCLVAWLIAESCEHFNIKYKVKLYFDNKPSGKMFIRNAFRYGEMGTFPHIALIINNRNINDCSCAYPYIEVSCIKSDWLKNCYFNNTDWNFRFDPRNSIIVERTLIKLFNTYNNEES